MIENKILLPSIENYLVSIGLYEKNIIPGRVSIWKNPNNSLEIVLPAATLVNHSQSESILEEAIFKIADFKNISAEALKLKLCEIDYDLLYVRAHGRKVHHGKINFSEGLGALNGLYEIIRSSAKRNIKAKGKKDAVSQYLSDVNMLAPKAGSFIYSVEMGLREIESQKEKEEMEIEGLMSLGRYLNSKLALDLATISQKIKSDSSTPAQLMNIGVDGYFCDQFLKLFSESASSLEFSFNWSFKEGDVDNLPEHIVFDNGHRDKIKRVKEYLSESKIRKFVDMPAYIEKYSWPVDAEKGRIYLRVNIDGKSCALSIEVDSDIYETLKREQAKKKILITCDLMVNKTKKMHVDVLKVGMIKVNPLLSLDF